MSDLDRLKELLLAEEREALARAEARVDTLERDRAALAQALPKLVRDAPSRPMASALAEPVAEALGSAVREHRRSIVDALFPIIGPMIRKAITEALRGLMSDLNGVLEQSFTLRGLRWRLEAMRSGVPYAQVVLRHGLRYRVDHVFLIERDSGLVLHRASAPDQPELDGDAIAGMLTAIGQFVRDSVGRDGGDALEAARVGSSVLWVVEGPRAFLACFIDGVPPETLRAAMADTLERLHATHADLGVDSALGEDAAALSPDALVAAAATGGDAPVGPARSPWPLRIVALVVLALVATWWVRSHRWESRVDTVRAALEAHPGFVLTSLSSRAWRSITIDGLVDADAEPPAAAWRDVDLGGVVPAITTRGYVSGDDAVVTRRALRLLAPPRGVSLTVAGGLLALRGEADSAWLDDARERAAWIAGVREVSIEVSDAHDARARAAAGLALIGREIESRFVHFTHDVEVAPDAALRIETIIADIARARALAGTAGVALRLHAEGLNDAPGSAAVNAELRAERAAWLARELVARGVPATMVETAGDVGAAAGDAILVRGARVRVVQEALAP